MTGPGKEADERDPSINWEEVKKYVSGKIPTVDAYLSAHRDYPHLKPLLTGILIGNYKWNGLLNIRREPYIHLTGELHEISKPPDYDRIAVVITGLTKKLTDEESAWELQEDEGTWNTKFGNPEPYSRSYPDILSYSLKPEYELFFIK